MAESITTDSRPSYGVTFERTISDGNYGSNKFSAWVSADVAADADDKQKAAALEAAAFIAKATVYAQIGAEFTNEDGILREAVKRVERAFPGTTDVSPSPTEIAARTDQSRGAIVVDGRFQAVKVKGQQHGELPSWLIEDAAKAGISEVYDNRDGLAENPKRPWFKATTGGKDARGFWPPKGR